VLRNISGSGKPAETSSEDSGSFAMKDLEPAAIASRPSATDIFARSTACAARTPAGPFSLSAAGQRLTDVVFKLMPFAVIAGRIVNEDSEPLPGVRISVYKYAYQKGKRRLTPAGTGMTNDLGEYRVFGLGRVVTS